jgi:hypothetical protein
MKSIVKSTKLVVFILALMSASPLFAQPPGGGQGGGGGPSSGGAPIDGGISMLVAGIAAYGAKKIRDKRKDAKAKEDISHL